MSACMIACLLASTQFSANDLADDEIRIVHINIGQGDSTLIIGPKPSTGDRVSVLIDTGDITLAGDPDGGPIVANALAENGITTLDWLILTHYDSDHIGGIIAGEAHIHGTSFVLGPDGEPSKPGDDDNDGQDGWEDPASMIKPDRQELAASGSDDLKIIHFVDRGDDSPPSTAAYDKYVGMADAMVAALAGQGAERVTLDNQADVDGFQITLGSSASMTCLAANGFVRNRTTRVASVNTENERSLCFVLRYKGFDYLIGGDTIGRSATPGSSENAEVEKAIGEFLEGQNIKIDVLHANHHGADNASATEFLLKIKPEVAIISVGNGNGHSHPSRDALGRLAENGVSHIFQTEWGTTVEPISEAIRQRQAIYQGDIILTTNGVSYTISTSRSFAVDN